MNQRSSINTAIARSLECNPGQPWLEAVFQASFHFLFFYPGLKLVAVISHRQHNAKLCVATHHAGICFGSLFQGIGFDHGAYPAQFGKAKRVI
jgi:hypothetical protein